MPFELPPLPYAFDALEPTIDAQTMEIHHDKHHGAYVTNLNAALEGTEFADRTIDQVIEDLEAIPEDKRTAVRNNGGGHLNHTLFWESMSPDGGGEPEGQLAEAISNEFGSFDEFKAPLRRLTTRIRAPRSSSPRAAAPTASGSGASLTTWRTSLRQAGPGRWPAPRRAVAADRRVEQHLPGGQLAAGDRPGHHPPRAAAGMVRGRRGPHRRQRLLPGLPGRPAAGGRDRHLRPRIEDRG